MRAVFTVVSLLVVLAVVSVLVARQWRATGQAVSAAAPAATGPASAAATPLEQSQQLQQRVRGDVGRALEAGAAAARKDESGQ